MEKELLAIHAQNSYAEKGMVDAIAVSEMAPPKGGSPPREKLADSRSEEEEAKKGIEDAAGEDREKADGNAKGDKAKGKGKDGESKEAKKPGRDYFSSTTPPPPEVAGVVAQLYADGEGRAIQDLSTRILVRGLLKLRNAARERGVKNLEFLSEIKTELASRGVHLELVQRTHDRLSGVLRTKGGSPDLELAGIDDPRLRELGEKINEQIGIVGEDYDVLNIRWGEVNALNGAVPEDQKRRLLNQISEAMKRSKEERARRSTEGRRPELGFYGERPLVSSERDAMGRNINEIAKRAWAIGKKLPTGSEITGDDIDALFNRIFDRANANARDSFHEAMGQTGDREHQDFVTELNQMRADAEKERDKNLEEGDSGEAEFQEFKAEVVGQFIEKYDAEYKMRSLLHNAFFIAETEGDFEQFAGFCKQFSSNYADLAFLDAPEVEAALRVREQVLYQFKREGNGFIKPELVSYAPRGGVSEWERRSVELMTELNQKGMFQRKDVRELPKWRIQRALSISRGMGMVMLRFPEISAEQIIPAAPATMHQSQPSIPWETLAWDLNPMDHKIKRYGMGRNLRGILYAARERKKKGFFDRWSQDEIRDALALDTITTLGALGDDRRMVDFRNMFKTGGPFTHTGWRPYTSALDENRAQLRPLLKRNPGLAMNLIFNRYENLDMGAERYKFFREHEGIMPPDQMLAEWGKQEKELKKTTADHPSNVERWETSEKNSWQKATRRIPHVVFRIITDRANALMGDTERIALLKRVSEELGIPIDSQAFTEVENALTLAKENLMKRRRDRGESFGAEEDQLIEADFEEIDNEEVKERAKKLHRFMVGKMDTDDGLHEKIAKTVKERGFAYAVTAEDVPWSEFYFGQTGNRGFFTRKINDAFSIKEADDELINLIKHIQELNSPEEIAGQLKKIFDKAEIYDWDRAQDTVADLCIGVVRFFQKDGILKIPILGELLGPINAIRGRGSSFAQSVYGGRAMDWDADEIYLFTEMLRPMFPGRADLIHRIREETGGTIWHAILRKTKIAFYLLMIFGSYEIMQKVIEEK